MSGARAGSDGGGPSHPRPLFAQWRTLFRYGYCQTVNCAVTCRNPCITHNTFTYALPRSNLTLDIDSWQL
eukprot:430678-Pyramimonas_sp.AAC.1